MYGPTAGSPGRLGAQMKWTSGSLSSANSNSGCALTFCRFAFYPQAVVKSLQDQLGVIVICLGFHDVEPVFLVDPEEVNETWPSREMVRHATPRWELSKCVVQAPYLGGLVVGDRGPDWD